MDYLVHGGDWMTRGVMALPRGSLLLIEHGRGMQIELWDGELWITHEGDERDHLIGPGTKFRLEREGILLANALKGAQLTLTAAVPAHYAERIVLTLAGSAPRVLYERSRERGGWLAGIGHRIARHWTNLRAPYSHPTTATLEERIRSCKGSHFWPQRRCLASPRAIPPTACPTRM